MRVDGSSWRQGRLRMDALRTRATPYPSGPRWSYWCVCMSQCLSCRVRRMTDRVCVGQEEELKRVKSLEPRPHPHTAHSILRAPPIRPANEPHVRTRADLQNFDE